MKRMIKCGHGHKYDKKKYTSCPHCGVDVNLDIVKSFNKSQNETLRKERVSTEIIKKTSNEVSTIASNDSRTIMSNDQRTVLSDNLQSGSNKTSVAYLKGWLIGIEGSVKYKDYRFNDCHTGFGIDFNGSFNHNVGNNLLALSYFELKWESNALLISNSGNEPVFVNRSILDSQRRILEGDMIKVLNNEFVVQFFKGGQYTWS